MRPEKNHRRIRAVFALVDIGFTHAEGAIGQPDQPRLITRVFFGARLGGLAREIPDLGAHIVPIGKTLQRQRLQRNADRAHRRKQPRALAVVKPAPAERHGQQHLGRRRRYLHVALQHALHTHRRTEPLIEQPLVFGAVRGKARAVGG